MAVLVTTVLLVGAASAGASSNLYYATGDDGANAQVLAFSLSSDGTPAPLQTFTGDPGGFFNAVSMSPDGKHLFMADYEKNQVRSMTVGADGKLTDAPGSPLDIPGSGPYGSAVTPDGKFLIVGLYDGHGVQVFAIGADGSLTATPEGPKVLGASVHPYSVAVSTDSRTLYVPDYSTDSLYSLRIGTDGSLSELPGSPLASGGNIYQAAVTPDGKYLYVPDQTANTVYGYALDSSGAPTALAGSPYAVMTNIYGGLAISPDGKTLYSSGSSLEIQSASIAPDGSLTAGPSIMVNDYNPGLTLNPSGSLLYNAKDANGPGTDLTTFSVDGAGALTPFGDPLSIGDGSMNPDSDSMVVTPAQPPVAALEAKTGSEGAVTLDASGSTDPDGPIASYAWDFGDGQTTTTTSATIDHTYDTDGSYPVSVTLTDADNCSTESVFTGRTAYCNGSAVAKASATAVAVRTVPDKSVTGARLKAAKVQKQKGKKLLIQVKAGAKEAVTLKATGYATFKKVKGKVKLNGVKGRAGAGKLRVLKLRSKSSRKIRSAIGKKGKATIKVKMTDKAGNHIVKKITVRLK